MYTVGNTSFPTVSAAQGGGQERILGLLPKVGVPFPEFGDVSLGSPPLIPEDKWYEFEDFSTDDMYWMTVDQADQNSCAGAGIIQAEMGALEYAGSPRVKLSQAVPYALTNGGHDNGAAIDAVMNAIMRWGTVPHSYISEYDWKGYWKKTWPERWKEIAYLIRAIEGWSCPTLQHLVSAIYHGLFPVLGVIWAGGGGHALVGTAYSKKRRKLRIKNSWSPEWGENGFGELPDSQVERGIPIFGAVAIRATTLPDYDAVKRLIFPDQE